MVAKSRGMIESASLVALALPLGLALIDMPSSSGVLSCEAEEVSDSATCREITVGVNDAKKRDEIGEIAIFRDYRKKTKRMSKVTVECPVEWH